MVIIAELPELAWIVAGDADTFSVVGFVPPPVGGVLPPPVVPPPPPPHAVINNANMVRMAPAIGTFALNR